MLDSAPFVHVMGVTKEIKIVNLCYHYLESQTAKSAPRPQMVRTKTAGRRLLGMIRQKKRPPTPIPPAVGPIWIV